MNSIFKKQFYIQIIILIISFLLLGVGLTNIFVNVFINQKSNALLKQGEEIAKSIENLYYWGGYYSQKELSYEVNILNKYLGASFIFVDENYEISIISNDIDKIWLGQVLDASTLKEIGDKQSFKFSGKMGGIFDEEVLTIGYSLFIDGDIAGTIFMSTSMDDIRATIKQVCEKILLLSLFVIGVYFVFIYIFSRKITLPLIEINKTAKIIANGDFEKRISIETNDEIGQLAQSFNEMAESLFEQEKRRREFISNISHDIRSPLTSIKGFLQAVLDKTISGDNQERYIKIVLEEVERLTILSNNILEINKIHFNNQLNYTKFDVNELIRLTIINLESRIVQKDMNINISFAEESTFVNADFDKIQRVIYNLLDNAIKFTDNKGQIFIETDLKEEKVLVSIEDTGCGIAEENQKRIFDRFYKEDTSRGNDKNGSGLGLSIIKEFILAHNQEITLKSELGKGSKFIFTLDRA